MDVLNTINTSTIINYHGRPVEILCHKTRLNRPFGIVERGTDLDFSFTFILLDMSIVLTLTHIMRYILKPLKQPKVIADVIAGIILGPSVLGHFPKFKAHVFPENVRFVVQNLGLIGFIYFLFVTGVKMDLGVITKSGKKQWFIALAGIAVPHAVIWSVALCIRSYMDDELRKFSSIGGVISALVITTFPVIYTVLKDMNLLSSEIGRMALSTVIISDVLGISVIVTFEAAKQSEHKRIDALYYVVSVLAVCGTVICGIPKAMAWINRRTPEGKPVEQFYVTAIFLGVFVIAYLTDTIGAAIGNGPLWLGLAIPDGPPLGATLVTKSETLMMQILMPFAYASLGLNTDVYAIGGCWNCLYPLFAMTVIGFLSKVVSVVIGARFMDMSYRDGFVLALMLSLRGQVEFLLYLHWMDLKMVGPPSFAMMMILTIIMTGIASPLISILYNPTRPYMTNKRRTIQHHAQNSEIRVISCIYDEESVASLCNLLEVSNASSRSPFVVFALHLIELVGRAAPVLINHEEQDEYWDTQDESIHNALKLYEEARSDYVTMHLFTAVTAQRTMYQDVCELALVKKASLIVLPFHRKCIDNVGGPGLVRPGVLSVNSNCLVHAPCSVAILVNKATPSWTAVALSASHREGRQFAMLFLGGPDAREALCIADRMVGQSDISMIVIRFLAQHYEGDNETERKLDDGVVTWFWVKNEMNERVVYREVVVTSGLDTISAIQAVHNENQIDLWIVGMKHGLNSVLLRGLTAWNESPELGTIGDYLASMDFSTAASVLVVQQQVLRDDHNSYGRCLGLQ